MLKYLVCTPGDWGGNCMNKCDCDSQHSNVAAFCDIQNGQCLCDAGYRGISCNQSKYTCGGVWFYSFKLQSYIQKITSPQMIFVPHRNYR